MASLPPIISKATPLFSSLTNSQHVNLFSQRRRTTSSCDINATIKHLSTPLRVIAGAQSLDAGNNVVVRRSGNYPPNIWHDDYLQSLNSVYSEETYKRRAEKMKDEVGLMIKESVDPSDQLKLIDDLERLGLWYHFEDEIDSILKSIFNRLDDGSRVDEDLFTASLKFRLLRQHGYRAPQEIFNKFKDKEGKFKIYIASDTKGLLSLYEASYLELEGETSLDEARDFARKHLLENLDLKQKLNVDEYLSRLITHSLKIPLHWRTPRAETRWFVDVYETRHDMNPLLLQFAKLDFNIVQAVLQKDLKASSRWWASTGFSEGLSFARDRVVENFMWSMGEIFQPEYGYCRVMSTKVNSLLTGIDDVYDVYGTLEELEIFTLAIERWDINMIDELPTYMKQAFLAMFNAVNEMAFVVLKEQGLHVISSLKKAWVDITKIYMKEAIWYHSGYKPTLEEYMEHAWLSCAAPTMIVHHYYFITNPITPEAIKALENYASIVRNTCTIVRLSDDMGTAIDEVERGDVPKSLQCHMNDTGASEEEARAYINELIRQGWKKINENILEDSPFPRRYTESAVNLVRVCLWMYEFGDAHGVDAAENKERVQALLIDPIPL